MTNEAASELPMEVEPQVEMAVEPEPERAMEQEEEDGKSSEEQEVENSGKEGMGRATVGSKTFGSSVEMFDYFFKILHSWPTNLNLNEYEHTMLLELLKKGHLEADKKIGKGVKAFQIRFHPQFKSRCFFLIREDNSVDDFSFRKCINHILPLPENMQIKHDVNKAFRGKASGRGRGRGRGRAGK
ncbi:UNVERIFIED_CONTAM: protein EMBRYO defective [Sesamum calycinum]|uniref:Protein EMBRYO defective n=1 Tax=Sesamum calycinum TaxID=2727403 RepID=A0AAW2NJK5_9LAMI